MLRSTARAGFALEATLIVMVLISALILAGAAGVMSTQRTTTVDHRNAQALYVAEGGADAVMAQLSSFMSDGFITDAEMGAIMPPSIPGWTFEAVTATKVGGQKIRTITDGDYAGLVSYNQEIDLRVRTYDVANNRGDVIITANAQAIPVFQFGVFYDEDLEIHPGADMTFEGWVHTNGNLYLSSNTLFFESLLTTPDSVLWQRKAYNDRMNGVRINDNAATATLLDFDTRSSTNAQFVSRSETRFDGRLRSGAHGVAPLRLPLPEGVPPITMIQPRVVGDNQQVRGVKFAWKADFVLRINLATQSNVRHNQTAHFCNDLASHVIRDSSFNALPNASTCKGIFKWNPTTSNASSPTLNPTRFRDGREGRTVYSLDIDIAALRTWTAGGWASRKIRTLYVEFYNAPANFYPAVRLINASSLPGTNPTPAPRAEYGLTVATHTPVYVKGNFNYDGNSANWKPASIVSDAIIFLSQGWDDSDNGCNYGQVGSNCGIDAASDFTTGAGFAANTQYIYAAIAAGHSPTTCDWQNAGCAGGAGQYGGGLENFPRFLENGGRTLFYRGSLVSLYFAQQAAFGPWNGSPYGAPSRDWRFDLRFQDPANLPPGTPLVGTVMQLAYRPVY
jgi:type II secretory pathway pseudopilin PulG